MLQVAEHSVGLVGPRRHEDATAICVFFTRILTALLIHAPAVTSGDERLNLTSSSSYSAQPLVPLELARHELRSNSFLAVLFDGVADAT